jgi:hypothetical protein
MLTALVLVGCAASEAGVRSKKAEPLTETSAPDTSPNDTSPDDTSPDDTSPNDTRAPSPTTPRASAGELAAEEFADEMEREGASRAGGAPLHDPALDVVAAAHAAQFTLDGDFTPATRALLDAAQDSTTLIDAVVRSGGGSVGGGGPSGGEGGDDTNFVLDGAVGEWAKSPRLVAWGIGHDDNTASLVVRFRPVAVGEEADAAAYMRQYIDRLAAEGSIAPMYYDPNLDPIAFRIYTEGTKAGTGIDPLSVSLRFLSAPEGQLAFPPELLYAGAGDLEDFSALKTSTALSYGVSVVVESPRSWVLLVAVTYAPLNAEQLEGERAAIREWSLDLINDLRADEGAAPVAYDPAANIEAQRLADSAATAQNIDPDVSSAYRNVWFFRDALVRAGPYIDSADVIDSVGMFDADPKFGIAMTIGADGYCYYAFVRQ